VLKTALRLQRVGGKQKVNGNVLATFEKYASNGHYRNRHGYERCTSLERRTGQRRAVGLGRPLENVHSIGELRDKGGGATRVKPPTKSGRLALQGVRPTKGDGLPSGVRGKRDAGTTRVKKNEFAERCSQSSESNEGRLNSVNHQKAEKGSHRTKREES